MQYRGKTKIITQVGQYSRSTEKGHQPNHKHSSYDWTNYKIVQQSVISKPIQCAAILTC